MRKPALTQRQIRYAARQRGKGRTLAAIAGELGVTPQHAGRLCAEFARTGQVHVQRRPGRRATDAIRKSDPERDGEGPND